MPSHLSALFAAWLSAEPMASSAMFVAAFLLFAVGVMPILAGTIVPGERAWRTMALLAKILAFVALIWGSYFLLRSSSDSFERVLNQLIVGGEQERKQKAQLTTNWGGSLNQSELLVQHYVEKEYVEEYPQPDQKPTLYLRKKVIEPLDQESIIGFQGIVNLHLVDPVLVTYECDATYQYDVMNASNLQTTAEYSFPFPSQRLYENVSVELDGRPVTWTIQGGGAHWKAIMSPNQESHVEISFKTRGSGNFIYSVPSPRVIQNYSLTVTVDSANTYHFVSPDSSAIRLSSHTPENAAGLVRQWTIDHAIMAPRVTVQFARPAKSSLSTALAGVVDYAARALVLMISLITLTLIICKENIRLDQLALVSSIFCAQFLALMAVYPLWGDFLWPAFLLPLATFPLYFLALKHVSRLPLTLALVVILLFAVGYPFVGLVPGERERNAIDSALQAGMILYMFGLTSYTRLRG